MPIAIERSMFIHIHIPGVNIVYDMYVYIVCIYKYLTISSDTTKEVYILMYPMYKLKICIIVS